MRTVPRSNLLGVLHTRFSTNATADAHVDLREDNRVLADGLLAGDRACLARLITLIESQRGK